MIFFKSSLIDFVKFLTKNNDGCISFHGLWKDEHISVSWGKSSLKKPLAITIVK
jgi:hypothetical protein